MSESISRPLIFNGVNATTGDYLLPPLSAEVISQIARGEPVDARQLAELKWRYRKASKVHFGVKAGIDSCKLEEAGWGVIFSHNASPAIQEALRPLFDRRKSQAGKLYREYTGSKGYRPNESKLDFLARHGAGPGPADPDKVPYYLLIVGDPEVIPFRFQYQLDVQYAVGRLAFDTIEEYANYARSVVEAETRPVAIPRRITFFAPDNAGDDATALSLSELVCPLAGLKSDEHPGIVKKLKTGTPAWESRALVSKQATKSALGSVLGGAETPAVLFTASHGVGFDYGDPLQIRRQGALLCQEWSAPPAAMIQPIPESEYFSQDDVASDANPFGLIAFFFACYGAGTPRLDDFAHAAFSQTRPALAPHAFLAGLPRRLLGHPKGGALAIIGHVDRAWGYSFQWENAGRQLQTFESTLKHLLEGVPVGAALEFFNERYSELSTILSDELEEIKYGKISDDFALAGLWTANNDSRSYVVLGDPAVRVAVPAPGQSSQPRPALSLTELPTTPIPVAAKSVSGGGSAVSQRIPQGESFLSVIDATEKRFRAISSEPTGPVSYAPGTPSIIRTNPPDCVRLRLKRLGISDSDINTILSQGHPSFAIIPAPGEVQLAARVGLERIISRNDLIGVEFLTAAVRAAGPVARVVIKSNTGLLGYGSGALISPRLFLTNNHVLSSASVAASSVVQFGYEYSPGGILQTPREIGLDPGIFFLTDVALDFTIVAVKSADNLGEYGFLTLNDDEGAVLKEEFVNIVQHPNGRPKQVALRDNQVTAILPEFLHYRADTEPGSSGAPVFNDQWELIGLHHSGVPKKNDQGQILSRGGAVWTKDMGDAAVDWVANEGIRIGRILDLLKAAPLPDSQKPAREELLSEVVSRPMVPRVAPTPLQPEKLPSLAFPINEPVVALSPDGFTVNVPIHSTISLGEQGLTSISISAPSSSDAVRTTPGSFDSSEAVSIDPNYNNRQGFDTNFLGTETHAIPLPKLPTDLQSSAAKNRLADADEDPYELPYHHYSVVLNATRRLAFFTAVNIDGRSHRRKDLKREKDKWLYDPRVRRDEQIGNELYLNNPFDRGHLVRRLDPAWGRSVQFAKVANDDTFHWTNCSPQHKDFNQGANLWAGLEDFLLDKASAEGKRLTVFTGPVFRDDDPVYPGVDFQIPTEFWKVAVYAKPDVGLVAAAFLVSQESLIRGLTQPVGMESAAEKAAMTFQVTVVEVEQLTKLNFGQLRKADVMTRRARMAFAPGAPAPRVLLNDENKIKVL